MVSVKKESGAALGHGGAALCVHWALQGKQSESSTDPIFAFIDCSAGTFTAMFKVITERGEKCTHPDSVGLQAYSLLFSVQLLNSDFYVSRNILGWRGESVYIISHILSFCQTEKNIFLSKWVIY